VAGERNLHRRHSTLPIERFVGLLRAYGIEPFTDIRTVPRSRHNPQFNRDALVAASCRRAVSCCPL
jgi:hypothetical protein